MEDHVEAVFDLILEMAKCKEVPREELPKQVLIILDMEFDAATASGYYNSKGWKKADETLFAQMVNNEEWLCLLSGFSQNAMKVAADKTKKDPYEALIATLDSARYQKIGEAIKEFVA